MSRQGLTGDNDKVYILGPSKSRPLGHCDNGSEQHVPNPDWDLKLFPYEEAILKQAFKYVADGVVRRTVVKRDRLPEFDVERNEPENEDSEVEESEADNE